MTTPVWLTGFNHGITVLNNSGQGLFASISGTGMSVVSTTKRRTGGRALRVHHTSSAGSYAGMQVGTSITRRVSRLYFWVDTLPSVKTQIVRQGLVSGVNMDLWVDTNGALSLQLGTTTQNWSGGNISTGTVYRFDYDMNVAANPLLCDWKINGTTQTQLSYAAAADAVSTQYWGAITSCTIDAYFTDILWSNTAADYPIGEGYVIGLRPTGDGTHNNTTNVLEDYNGNDIDGVNYFAYAQLDDDPWTDSITSDLIRCNVAGASNYLEITFSGAPAGTVQGVIGLLQYASAGTQANNGACQVRNSEGTATTIWGSPSSPADYSEGAYFTKKAIATAPSGGWNQTEVNAIRVRLGYSADATPDPYWIAIMLEVAYADTGVTVLLDTAAMTASGVVLSVSAPPPPLSILLDTAGLTANGVSLVVSPGGVAQTIQLDTGIMYFASSMSTGISLSTAAMTLAGQVLDVVPGLATVQLNTGAATLAGQVATILAPAPATTVNLNTASMTLAGPVLDVVPGVATVLLNVALLTVTGQTADVVPGPATVLLNTGAATLAGQIIDVVIGATVILDTAALSLAGQVLDVVPGAVTINLSTATMTLAGVLASIVPGTAAVLLDTATGLLSGIVLSVIAPAPGATTVVLDTALMQSAGIAFDVVPGLVTVILDTATATLLGQLLDVVPGAVTTILDTAITTLMGQVFDVVPGTATILLNTSTMTLTGRVIAVVAPPPGTTTVVLDTAVTTLAGQVLDVVPGLVTIQLDVALTTVSGVTFTVSAPVNLVVSLDTATAILAGQLLDVVPGVAVVDLTTGLVTMQGQVITTIPGAVSIVLDAAEMLMQGQHINVVLYTSLIKAMTFLFEQRSATFTVSQRSMTFELKERTSTFDLEE